MFHYFKVVSSDGFLSIVRAVSIESVCRCFPNEEIIPTNRTDADMLVCNGIKGFVCWNGKIH